MKVSEAFFSVQGEGVSQGQCAFFLRLSRCNLHCGGPRGCLVGKEVEGKKVSWFCDTEMLLNQGIETSNEELLARIEAEGQKNSVPLAEWLRDGIANFVWTGGEPALKDSREGISSFLDLWNNRYPQNRSFHEIETNGTIECPNDLIRRDCFNNETYRNFYNRFDQINVSPKLANSGMKKVIRIIPEAIKQINNHRNSWFKFVINFEEDIQEIKETFLEPFDIDPRKVILMPGVDNREDLPEKTRFLYEMCKKYGFRGITRTQILVWGKRSGV
jgi:organic radical activating enzyme